MKHSRKNDPMPAEVNFSKGVRGLHHISSKEKVMMPTSIEKSVWEYFSGKAEERGVELSNLLTEVLKRDIEIHEVLKWCDSIEPPADEPSRTRKRRAERKQILPSCATKPKPSSARQPQYSTRLEITIAKAESPIHRKDD